MADNLRKPYPSNLPVGEGTFDQIFTSPEFAPLSPEQKIQFLKDKFPNRGFAKAPHDKQLAYIERKGKQIDARIKGQEKAANEAVKASLMAPVLAAPVAGGMVGGNMLAGRLGLGAAGKFAGRMAGTTAGSVAQSAMQGQDMTEGMVNLAMNLGVQAIPELGTAATQGVRYLKSGMSAAKALTRFEDEGASNLVSKMADAVPWWKHEFAPDHSGLNLMVGSKGEDLLHEGYENSLRMIKSKLQGTTINLPVEMADKYGLVGQIVPHHRIPQLQLKEVPMTQLLDRLPKIRTAGDTGASDYRQFTHMIDRTIDDMIAGGTKFPEKYIDMRKAYANGMGFVEAARKWNIINPDTHRFDSAALARGYVKDPEVFQSNISPGRSPQAREAFGSTMKETNPAPARDPLMSFHAGLPGIGHARMGFSVGEKGSNVPNFTPYKRGTSGLPQSIMGSTGALAKEAVDKGADLSSLTPGGGGTIATDALNKRKGE